MANFDRHYTPKFLTFLRENVWNPDENPDSPPKGFSPEDTDRLKRLIKGTDAELDENPWVRTSEKLEELGKALGYGDKRTAEYHASQGEKSDATTFYTHGEPYLRAVQKLMRDVEKARKAYSIAIPKKVSFKKTYTFPPETKMEMRSCLIATATQWKEDFHQRGVFDFDDFIDRLLTTAQNQLNDHILTRGIDRNRGWLNEMKVLIEEIDHEDYSGSIENKIRFLAITIPQNPIEQVRHDRTFQQLQAALIQDAVPILEQKFAKSSGDRRKF